MLWIGKDVWFANSQDIFFMTSTGAVLAIKRDYLRAFTARLNYNFENKREKIKEVSAMIIFKKTSNTVKP